MAAAHEWPILVLSVALASTCGHTSGRVGHSDGNQIVGVIQPRRRGNHAQLRVAAEARNIAEYEREARKLAGPG